MTSPPDLIAEVFKLIEPSPVRPNFNAAPTQLLPVVRAGGDGNRLDHLRWGLVPSWARDIAIGNRMINARSETAAEKPSFRKAFRERRCLVVVDGFYEWMRSEGPKRPFCIGLREPGPFGLAGLWSSWTSPEGGLVETFTILTTGPNELMRPLHDRMPVILDRSDHERWLDPGLTDPGQMTAIIGSFPPEQMRCWEVSTHVNSPRNNDPSCVAPLNGSAEAG